MTAMRYPFLFLVGLVGLLVLGALSYGLRWDQAFGDAGRAILATACAVMIGYGGARKD